ncbi:MAG: hypothetical protein PHP08_00740 [Candidatus Dojkabacteria bacterium]|nr:hypothetical protein [Candidatus Dojkabacteria bacterium]
MEVKTKEVIRYIDLRFIEQDLKDLINEIIFIESDYKSSYHDKNKLVKMKKLIEFKDVVARAIGEVHN